MELGVPKGGSEMERNSFSRLWTGAHQVKKANEVLMYFNHLAIDDPRSLLFGTAPKPVTTKRGLVIGGGTVYPELNFTLPPITICDATLSEIRRHYEEIVSEALARAYELHSNGLVLEFETLVEMTKDPKIGIMLTGVMNDICEEWYAKRGLKSGIRLTPNDIRDFDRPPLMRSSSYMAAMLELFEQGALAGGDLLSIESTGGKEIHDDALLTGNIRQAFFALTVLGVRDMKFLWKQIVDIARRTGRIPGGDTACGFGNTAMVLAEKGYISKVFAAIDRVVTVVRSLVAYEEGALGPGKDCGYEGPYLKAIAGIPISMEGRTAACAHMSPVGNISSAACDLWSNESVQHIKLLGGIATTVYLEQLEYDVRLMNQAIRHGPAARALFQTLNVESDVHFDPQAVVLAPEVVVDIADKIVRGKNYIDAAKRGALRALDIIEERVRSGSLLMVDREFVYIDKIRQELGTIPEDESRFVEEMLPELDLEKVILKEYGL
jgi:methanol--5-hydroxybenzimidazolylcobamide Co-methyltransferase